ncbi:MAG: serine hydrolase [Bacteroidota bacterium]
MKLTIRNLGLLILCIYLSIGSLSAQKKASQKAFEKSADKFYKSTLEEFGSVPGVSIVVVQGDKTLYKKGFGYADLENKLKSNAESNYYIASSTKSFTALLASLMDKEDIIKLDDPLSKYFPTINFPEDVPVDQIKIRDLLTHTSGIDNSPIGFRVAYTGNHDFQTRLNLMKYCEANKVGHGTFSYTNVGYNIYAIILEKVTGKNWRDHLEERIFTPLGMNRTTGYISKAEEGNWPLAAPYLGRSVENIERVYLNKQDNTMQAAGGLITNADDLANWLKVQIGNGKLNGKQIFPREIVEANRQAITDGKTPNPFFVGEGYGLGWQIGHYKGEKAVWHFGGFPGFLTNISFLPEKGIGVAVMVNEGIAGNGLKDLYAAFAYDYLLGNMESEEDFKKTKEELLGQIRQLQERVANHEADLAKREWKLSLPFEDYCGTFESERYGKIEVKMKGKEIFMQYGNLYCVPTPYKEQDMFRAGWIPGSGRVVPFLVEEGKVMGLRYMGEVFEKIEG